MSSRRIDIGELSLCVTERGQGFPVVVLHGFTGCAASMQSAAETLAANFYTLSIDLIGHGASDAPDDVADYAMAACVGQLDKLLDRLDIERAHWLGYSMGGRTALQFAVAHPRRVERLLLVGASAGLSDPAARAARIESDEALADRIESDGVENFVDAWMALPLFASQKRLGDEALCAARGQRLQNQPHALANSLRGMGSGAQSPLQSQLPDLRAPVCLVVGDEDQKFQAIAADLANRLPNASVEILTESGHAAHLENPADFGRIAERFFALEIEA
ncbi:MAG: 2-succinyl-6-hydroxy-2,4-cyclohexadiene-1-carboxylate synthase [Myxococcota bacterium]|nr:2-succinyl-6-hydroxy-2,4-cyclohexadiene-1-carboxylate synthase [Myxococcota bacterium]